MKKLFKKSLAVILVVVLTLTAAPLGGFVGLELPSLFDFKAEAHVEEDITDSYYCCYIIKDGEAALEAFVPKDTEDDISYTIPATIGGYPVTSILVSAFSMKAENLTSVIIPGSVSTIGESAFDGCARLKSVSIGYGVTTIETGAFSDCIALKSISIPDSVKTIGNLAFSGCETLRSATIPGSIKTISGYAFYGCYALTSVTIGSGVKVIGEGAFSGCTSLASISIPNSVTTIEDNAFETCRSLTSVTIPSSVTVIGDNAFAFCEKLINVSFHNKIIGPSMFAYCNNLKQVIISDSVTTVNGCAFYPCDNLEYIHIPSSVTEIGSGICGRAFTYICSSTENCCAKEYADANGIEFRLCNGHGSGDSSDNPDNNLTDDPNDNPNDTPSDDPTDKPTNKTYKIYGREFKHNLDYFAKNGDSSKYDPELANMLAALSAAAYDEETVKNAYKELGFDDCETFNYDGFTLGKVAYSLAFKKSDNSDETICLVTVRGTVNTSEWLGNANISTTNGKHDGFLNATNKIYDNIQNYIASNNITGDVKYFVTGHSRGAAVGNLLSVGLMENGVASSDVYNYNYACPDVAFQTVFPDYNNIFNVCNTADVVTHVPGEIGNVPEYDSKWDKYGKTHWFTMDIPDTGNIVQDVKNDHNVDFYLRYMDQQLDPSEWWYIDSDNNSVIGYNAKVLCPVDVIVTDENGKRIASVINGEIDYYDSQFGEVIILTDGDKKAIYVNGDKDFNVNLIGTDSGEMTYSVEKYNIYTEETLESKTFENVKLEKGKEMISAVCGDKTADDVSLYVYETANGEKTVKYAVNTDGSEIEISEAFRNLAIKQPSVTTVNYGDTLVLSANIGDYVIPEGCAIAWFVEGTGVSTSVSEDGLECRVTSIANGNLTVYAKLVDEEENPVTNADGEAISDEITLVSKAGFWQKFVSFFKNLFGINRIIY